MPLFSRGLVIVFWNLQRSCLHVKSGGLWNAQFHKFKLFKTPSASRAVNWLWFFLCIFIFSLHICKWNGNRQHQIRKKLFLSVHPARLRFEKSSQTIQIFQFLLCNILLSCWSLFFKLKSSSEYAFLLGKKKIGWPETKDFKIVARIFSRNTSSWD